MAEGNDLSLLSGTGPKRRSDQSQKGDEKWTHRGNDDDLTNGAKTCIFNPDGVFGIHRSLDRRSTHSVRMYPSIHVSCSRWSTVRYSRLNSLHEAVVGYAVRSVQGSEFRRMAGATFCFSPAAWLWAIITSSFPARIPPEARSPPRRSNRPSV